MALEHFRRKQQLFSEVINAFECVKSLVPMLSPDERASLLDELTQALSEPLGPSHVQDRIPPVLLDLSNVGRVSSERGETPPTPPQRTPSEAVEEALRQHPEGLKAREIVKACLGKFVTTSDEPANVLYSALAGFKKRGKVEVMPDGSYRLTRRTSDLSGKTAIQCCVEILKNSPISLSALTIARIALSRGYTGRATGTGDALELTTAKSFWARMSKNTKIFEQTEPETYKLRDGVNPDEINVDNEEE